MAEQDDVRDDLDTELFGFIGKDVTIYLKEVTTNDRGEEDSATYTAQEIIVVPYSINQETRAQLPFGDLPEGSMAIVLRYDQVVRTGDIIELESENWEVREIERNYLPDNVATIVGVVRAHNQETIVVEVLGLLDSNGDTLLDSNGDTLKVTS